MFEVKLLKREEELTFLEITDNFFTSKNVSGCFIEKCMRTLEYTSEI